MILGINGHPEFAHDSAIAVIMDGAVVAVFEEERFSRRKKGRKTFPRSAARAIAQEFPGEPVEKIGYAWNPRKWGERCGDYERLIAAELRRAGIRLSVDASKVEFIDHHLAHAWSAQSFLLDEKRSERVLHVVLDGHGETGAGAVFVAADDSFDCIGHLSLGSSLGLLYESVSQSIGFAWGQEGKTMGLASYGEAQEAIGRTIEALAEGDLTWSIGSPSGIQSRLAVKARYNEMRAKYSAEIRPHLTPPENTFVQRAAWAASAQMWLEQSVRRLVEESLEMAPDARYVAFSGGVALNCSVNSYLERWLGSMGYEFSAPPCASDCGVALGAALGTAYSLGHRVESVTDAFLGHAAYPQELEKLGLDVRPASPEQVARELCGGAVFGRIEGRAEIGPRALGNRSIISLPVGESVRDRVNLMKNRESWRPLAPIIDVWTAAVVLDGPSDQYMLRTAKIVEEESLLAVRHVDGTTRPKVSEPGEVGLNALLESVRELTGFGAVLCTSFNGAGEPIVNDMSDAVRSGRRLGLSGLCGDGWIALL